MNMTTMTKVVASIAFLALLAAPASARIEGDEGGLSAYPQFGAERNSDWRAAPGTLVNRPHQR
jgi:hypothetical protein